MWSVPAYSSLYAAPPGKPRRIGMLLIARSPTHDDIEQFRNGLKEAGFVEGRDVVIQYAYGAGDYERLPGLVSALLRDNVEIIVVEGSRTALAAAHATASVPIVMASVGDPIFSGLVSNLTRPGGNVTGLSMMITDLESKRLQLLQEAVSTVRHVATWWNPDNSYHQKLLTEAKTAAAALSFRLSLFPVRSMSDFGPAFASIAQRHADAVNVFEDPIYFNHREALAQLAFNARLPSMFGTKAFIHAGGLLSYGVDYGERFHRAASYVVRILQGAAPGDLPIEQPSKFDLAVNLKTAKAIGVKIPESIKLRADEIVQ